MIRQFPEMSLSEQTEKFHCLSTTIGTRLGWEGTLPPGAVRLRNGIGHLKFEVRSAKANDKALPGQRNALFYRVDGRLLIQFVFIRKAVFWQLSSQLNTGLGIDPFVFADGTLDMQIIHNIVHVNPRNPSPITLTVYLLYSEYISALLPVTCQHEGIIIYIIVDKAMNNKEQ